MVLEELDSPPDSSSTASGSPGNDAYSSNQSPQFYVNAESLQKRLPLPMLGNSESQMRLKLQLLLQGTSNGMGRPVTADEAQAFASHIYDMEAKKSYYGAAGGLAGIYRWYDTMKTNQYPFYAPKNVDPNKFLWIKGPFAQIARHSWRLACYWIVATELGKTIGHFVMQPITTKAIVDDPRLRQVVEDTKAAGRANASGMRPDITNRRREMQGNSSGASSRNQAQATGSDDDMSPTAFADGPWNSSTNSPDFPHDDDSSNRPSGPFPQNPSPAWSRRPLPPPPQQQQKQQPFDDDASPTGGLFQAETQESANAPGSTESTGSAWERLRRGGSLPPIQRPPPPGRPPRRAQPEDSTIGDSFTFANSDEERQRAQEQAQREFDERLERERQGKDFNDEGRRW
ncbi:hypothetical protein DM02DRAFT_318609 [Periconia macrospinosa]|uniref:Uncharacterized protein n=1 Tax=Periconia macrospinosa TaxID=97972 RepID=A0A2V1DXW0_9PLEO|nr:hypothetical protein DM02DRAFT_318609 [Periconia macrospinosa]